MKKYFIDKVHTDLKLNRGELLELAYKKMLDNNYIWHKDSTNHRTASDIPSLNASLKCVNGCTLEKCVNDLDNAIVNYLTTDFSSKFLVGFDLLHPTQYGILEMNKTEMLDFLRKYAILDRQSTDKGGAITLRIKMTSTSKQKWVWNDARPTDPQTSINFDLDGTIYDLYNVDGWLDGCRNGVNGIFLNGNALVDLEELEKVCLALQRKGYEINIITWTPMTDNKNAIDVCLNDKMAWLKKNMPYTNNIAIINYGIAKTNYANAKTNILFDDNAENITEWVAKGNIGYDEKNIIETLKGLL
jgi:hypothetical protein